MKILILANYSMGLHNFRLELIEELISQGHKVFFSLPESSDDGYVKCIANTGACHIQTQVNRRSINPLSDLILVRSYKRIIKETDPDVILTYTIKPNIYGTYAASRLKKPVIMNVTGIGSALTNPRLRQIVLRMYKYACSKAVKIFFQNKENLNFFIGGSVVKSSKTALLPGSGVNTAKFSPQDKQKNDGVIRFLFIGRLMKEKGVSEYLDAARAITEMYKNIEFQLLGPFEEEEYRTQISAVDEKRIKYLGVSRDVRKEIRETDCIVNPSYHEGMSNVLLEAASMAKPVIASDIPGCREIIEHGRNGFLFKPGSSVSLQEKIIQFIELKEHEKIQMGNESRRKVEKEFDRNIIVEEYVKEIEKLRTKDDKYEYL
jgi:galacturonosyltransferase